MKREASSLLRNAGYKIEWRNLDSSNREDAPLIAVIDLNGTCGLPPGSPEPAGPPPNGQSLATTSITDGRVLPFAAVNCGALTRTLSPDLVRESGGQRDFLYGRAMGRVIAHELYHILTRTVEHSKAGVARSCFSPSELTADHFEFEAATLAQLRRKPDGVSASVAVVGEDASDR
jgi:hypothetical protein